MDSKETETLRIAFMSPEEMNGHVRITDDTVTKCCNAEAERCGLFIV